MLWVGSAALQGAQAYQGHYITPTPNNEGRLPQNISIDFVASKFDFSPKFDGKFEGCTYVTNSSFIPSHVLGR